METRKFFNAVKNGMNLTERIKTYEDFYKGLMDILPNPSKLLKEQGFKIFAQTGADTTVRGAVNTIFEGVGSLEWEIVKNDVTDSEIELATQTIEKLMKNNLVKQILWAVFFGFQPLNVVWKNDKGKYSIDCLIELPHDSIIFNYDRKVRIITTFDKMNGEEPEPYRFIMPTYDSNYHNPYGTGLFLNCYKHVFIKNNVLDFWTLYAEDYGTPGIMGQFTQAAASVFGMSPEEFVSYFYSQIEDMRGKKVIVHPEGTDISAIPAGSNATAEIFGALINFCKGEINSLILGHESASSSTPGKLGNEQMASSAKTDRVESFTEFLTYYINELLKWQHELNFPGEKYCQIRFYEKDDIEVYTKKAVLVKELAAVGVEFNEDYIESEFNIDKKYFKLGNIPDKSIQKQTTDTKSNENSNLDKFFLLNQHQIQNSNEKNDLDTLDQFTDFVLESKEFKNLNEETLSTIVAEIKKFDSLEEMQDEVFNIFDKLDINNKQALIKKFMLISAVYGYNNKPNED